MGNVLSLTLAACLVFVRRLFNGAIELIYQTPLVPPRSPTVTLHPNTHTKSIRIQYPAPEIPFDKLSSEDQAVMVQLTSVNFHVSRICNYSCKFCFHDTTGESEQEIEKAKEGLRLLMSQAPKLEKVNFAGGEPFMARRGISGKAIPGKWLGEVIKYCKEVLNISSVSIVSNGSKITEGWFVDYGKYLDILAVSIDSFDEETCKRIGRTDSKKNTQHIEQVKRIASWCSEYDVVFKINTVVCSENKDENMVQQIKELAPKRWKVFQCLILDGENAHKAAAQAMTVTTEEFQKFLQVHTDVGECLVPEDNEQMINSYVLLDQEFRFLDSSTGGKKPSPSIFKVPVIEAFKQSGFDADKFLQRGGKYEYRKEEIFRQAAEAATTASSRTLDIEDCVPGGLAKAKPPVRRRPTKPQCTSTCDC